MMGNAGATVRMTLGLHGITEAMCARYRVKWTEVAPATVRKHFLGKANAGSRAQTKAAVVARCHLLGFLDRSCKDEDRADAISIFDWAASQHRRPEALHLFGEAPAPFVSIGDAAAAVVRKVRRGRAA
jgi:Holliday junction resolvasome RuvABC endonuclease subunit